MLFQHLRQGNGLVEIPSARGPIGRRDTHQHRHVVGNHGTDGIDHLDHDADAVLERSAVFVLALVDQRIEELRQQVAMRRMHLDRVEADLRGAPCGVAETTDDGMDLIHRQFAGHGIFAERLRAWSDGLPSAEFTGHAGSLESKGEASRGAFAPGMVELHRQSRAGLLRIGDDPTPRIHLRIVPQSQIARRDAAFRSHRGGLDDHHAESAHGARHVMLVVERRRFAVACRRRIRVHRRQPDTIAHGQAAQRDRFEQACRTALFRRFLAFPHDLPFRSIPTDLISIRIQRPSGSVTCAF